MSWFTNISFIFVLFTILIDPIASHQLSSQSCQDYTIDKCFYDENGIIETLKDVDEQNCQFYCDVIYKGICNFFIHDHKQMVCQLLEEPFGNYVDSCKKFGGPPSPSVDTCKQSTNPCKVNQYTTIHPMILTAQLYFKNI